MFFSVLMSDMCACMYLPGEPQKKKILASLHTPGE